MSFVWIIIIFIIVGGLMYITNMPGSSYSGPFHALSEDEHILRDNLKRHVLKLAEDIGERNIWQYSELEASALYIEQVFLDLGYEINRQEFEVNNRVVWNIEAQLTGTFRSDEIIVVGAHYDSVAGSPGANDNASGVAAVLEFARLLAGQKLSRTVRLVAFVNEEPPFFQTKHMGSRVYAAQLRQHEEQIMAMISMETIGFYSDTKGSQHYPFPLSFFYPNTANFIGFVGNMSSRHLVHQAISIFRKHTAFPSEGVAAPGWMMGIGWSDHWSFWKEGYPAIMITDTALFRYEYYHAQEDLPNKIDYERMARVVAGIAQIIKQYAG